jgi:hypothetical protein
LLDDGVAVVGEEASVRLESGAAKQVRLQALRKHQASAATSLGSASKQRPDADLARSL